MAEVDSSRSRWMLPGVLVLSTFRGIFRVFKWLIVTVLAAIAFIFVSNLLLFPTYRDIPSRALAPESASCADARSPGWDALSAANNDEWQAIDQNGISVRKLACSIQHHIIPIGNSSPAKASEAQKSLSYDLGFIEFQEDGKPYALRKECDPEEACAVEQSIPVRRQPKGQLEALVEHLKQSNSNYVVVFIQRLAARCECRRWRCCKFPNIRRACRALRRRSRCRGRCVQGHPCYRDLHRLEGSTDRRNLAIPKRSLDRRGHRLGLCGFNAV
jgi:hypothetical protein